MYQELHFYSNGSDSSFPVSGSPFVDRFKILSVSIPLTYNTTDAQSNKIAYSRSGSTKTATVPVGSYNSATFPSALEDALNASSDVKDFAVSFDNLTRKLTITASQPFSIRGDGTTMNAALGLQKNQNTPSATSVTFGNVADFTQSSPLLLTSTSLFTKSVILAGSEQVSILATVPITSAQGTLGYWANTNGEYLYCGTNVNRIDFKLLSARTLQPVNVSGFSVSVGILSDSDDVAGQ